MTENDFGKMLEGEKDLYRKVKIGEKVKGKIIHIGSENAFVDIGSKSDGIIATDELRDNTGKIWAKEGDDIEAFVINLDNGVQLSRALSGDFVSREMIQDAFEKGIPVEGKVISKNKGGFTVKVMGERAFCPISQIDNKYVSDPDNYVNKTFKFKIIELRGGRNIVLSRRVFLDEDKEFKANVLMKQLEDGGIIEGTVGRIIDSGAFIDLGGIDGFLHISELKWERVSDVKNVLSTGDKVKVKIIKIDKKDPKKPRISLSIKQLNEHPFYKFIEENPEGSIVKGKVSKIMPFGAFVTLVPGVDGLVHISEMSAEKRISTPTEVVKEGDEVEVMVIGINADKKELKLSIKALAGNPWDTVHELFHVGGEVSGTVENVNQYGVFVKLNQGVIGLLPLAQIGKKRYEIGENIVVKIANIDDENKRIRLVLPGNKVETVEEDNWKKYVDKGKQQDEEKETLLGALLKEALAKKSK